MFFGVDPSDKNPEQLAKAVKRAYRLAVLKHHPDRGGNPEDFRKIQDAYDAFKKHIGNPKTNPLRRPIAYIFFAFRDFVCSEHRFSDAGLDALAYNDEEIAWLVHFLNVGIGAGFLIESQVGGYLLAFMDSKITLPRFYRAFALKYLSKNDAMYKQIELMFSKQFPWNYELLRDKIKF
jgi:hypothetical protein